MSIEIESGVPLPPRQNRRNTYIYYPWSEMKVGNSFVLPAGFGTSHASALTGARCRKHPGEQYQSATTADGRIRIWRVA